MGGEIKCGPKTDHRPRFRPIARANCVCLYEASTLFNFAFNWESKRAFRDSFGEAKRSGELWSAR